jgi:hypothetical protein
MTQLAQKIAKDGLVFFCVCLALLAGNSTSAAEVSASGMYELAPYASDRKTTTDPFDANVALSHQRGDDFVEAAASGQSTPGLLWGAASASVTNTGSALVSKASSTLNADATDMILIHGATTANVQLSLAIDGAGSIPNTPYGTSIGSNGLWAAVDVKGSTPASLSLGFDGSGPFVGNRQASLSVASRTAVSHQLSVDAAINTARPGAYAAAASGTSTISVTSLTPGVDVKLRSQLTDGDVRSKIKGSVDYSAVGKGMTAQFVAPYTLTLKEAADVLHYDHFNWFQVVAKDPYPTPFSDKVPYVDPVPRLVDGSPNALPGTFNGVKEFADKPQYYWNEEGAVGMYHLKTNSTVDTLLYADYPAELRLQAGQSLEFVTALAGVRADGTWDNLLTFTWSTDATGTVEGGSARMSLVAPEGGTGGVFDIHFDVSFDALPEQVRQTMIAAGARNMGNSSVPEPLAILHAAVGGLILAGVLAWRRRQSKARA